MGAGIAHTLPSDFVTHHQKPTIIELSGTDPEIFDGPGLQMAPLGLPHRLAGDLAQVDINQSAGKAWAAAGAPPLVNLLNETGNLTPKEVTQIPFL
jgi:hypothetical protein